MTRYILDFTINTEKELIDCLDSLRPECIKLTGIDLIVDRAFEYWNIFKNRIYFDYNRKLRLPDIEFDPTSPTDYLGLIISFCWVDEIEWLCCELLVDGSFEFKYRNKLTKEELGENYHSGDNGFPEGAFELLSRFAEELNNGH